MTELNSMKKCRCQIDVNLLETEKYFNESSAICFYFQKVTFHSLFTDFHLKVLYATVAQWVKIEKCQCTG